MGNRESVGGVKQNLVGGPDWGTATVAKFTFRTLDVPSSFLPFLFPGT